MISYFLEKRRIAQQRTILGVEYDSNSIAMVKLDKKQDGYALEACSTSSQKSGWFVETDDAFMRDDNGAISEEIKNFSSKYKVPKNTKLGYTSYTDIDFFSEKIKLDKKAIEAIEQEGESHYIREFFLKKKFKDDYLKIPFASVMKAQNNKSFIDVSYMADENCLKELELISKKAKKELAIVDMDKQAVIRFVEELYTADSNFILLGLYNDKLTLYYFSNERELVGYENMKLFDRNISLATYVDDVLAFVDRFIEMLILENMEDENYIVPKIKLFGLKEDFVHLVQNIKNLSEKECSVVDPFQEIDTELFGNEIENKHCYVIPVGLALRGEF